MFAIIKSFIDGKFNHNKAPLPRLTFVGINKYTNKIKNTSKIYQRKLRIKHNLTEDDFNFILNCDTYYPFIDKDAKDWAIIHKNKTDYIAKEWVMPLPRENYKIIIKNVYNLREKLAEDFIVTINRKKTITNFFLKFFKIFNKKSKKNMFINFFSGEQEREMVLGTVKSVPKNYKPKYPEYRKLLRASKKEKKTIRRL